jgi:hypothetical protein
MPDPGIVIALRDRFPAQVETLSQERPLLSQSRSGQEEVLFSLLQEEEVRERNLDRTYWVPLRRELEQWRRGAIINTPKF